MTYPVGTKCVVTWPIHTESDLAYRAGYVVEIAGSEQLIGDATNMPAQVVLGKCAHDGCACQSSPFNHKWPIAWMRPLENPDAEQVTEKEKEALYER